MLRRCGSSGIEESCRSAKRLRSPGGKQQFRGVVATESANRINWSRRYIFGFVTVYARTEWNLDGTT